MTSSEGDGKRTERGRPGGFDPETGEVHGSGSGAGAGGNLEEDYDSDPMGGARNDPHGGARPARDAVDRTIDKDEGV